MSAIVGLQRESWGKTSRSSERRKVKLKAKRERQVQERLKLVEERVRLEAELTALKRPRLLVAPLRRLTARFFGGAGNGLLLPV